MIGMIQNLLIIPRKIKQLMMLFFDMFVIIICLFVSFFIRLGYEFYPALNSDLLIVIFGAPILALPIFIYFGFYHEVIRYVGGKALFQIFKGVSIYAVLWGLVIFMIAIEGVPRSVIIINWLLLIIIFSCSRFIARWLLSEVSTKNNVLIYGAGAAGRELSIALSHSREYKPIAFIDDDSEFQRHFVNGLKVYSPGDLKELIFKNNIKEVLLAIPSISRTRRKEIINYLTHYSVEVRSLPGVSELVQGKIKVDDLLEINLIDLLGRQPASVDKSLLKGTIFKKVVLVTGAGGSIGSELCRQILLLKPEKIVLYEISESSLYQIDQELSDMSLSETAIIPVLGSVLDKERLTYICSYYGVRIIYHAAAYKHVPLVEFNSSQGVLNNAIGTMVAAKVAIAVNIETFILISTDKAVRPTNVMGATKRVAELTLQALAKNSHNTCFTMVRFGNVLNSSGSVIPLFKKQIKAGGPITVTHADVVRYFMTIPEAVELVMQAVAMAKGGEVFVLDMGEPVRIDDLAKKMIKLSGMHLKDKNNPMGDIEIEYTGLRAGEKLYEELLIDSTFSPTNNKLIMQAEEKMIIWSKLEPMLSQIKKSAINDETENIYKLLKKIVPHFKPEANGSDIDLKDSLDIKNS